MDLLVGALKNGLQKSALKDHRDSDSHHEAVVSVTQDRDGCTCFRFEKPK